MVRVAILGAGVCGLASAVKIKEKLTDAEVVLFSKEFSPNTTGNGSAGFWFPYLCGKTPSEKLQKWGISTYKFVHKLWLEGLDGISLVPAHIMHEKNHDIKDPDWKDSVFGYHNIDKRHLQYLSDLHSADYKSGICFTSFTAEPNVMLPYLMGRFKEAGGKVQQVEIVSLNDALLNNFDIIVNCTGMGAEKIVPDKKVFPIRGQVTRVKAPWVYDIFINDTIGTYIIPNVKTCVLGGTHQENDYNTSVNPKDSLFIMEGCKKMRPTIVRAQVLSEWVGLRPGREIVKLEVEALGKKIVIHNYGHGGSGVTLFWGCAGEVLEILERNLQHIKPSTNDDRVRSKL